MKRKKYLATAITVLSGAAFLVPSLQARVCAGNGDLVGSYGFAGSRGGYYLLGATAASTGSPVGTGPMVPLSATPPGTATGTGTSTVTTQLFAGSNTPIGSLVAELNNPNVFSSAGRFFLDGMGNVYSSPTVGLMSNFMVGAYNVVPDCSVTVTLYDPFQTGTAPGTTPLDTFIQIGKVTFQGFVANSAQAVYLAATSSNAAGATITLSKTAQFSSCTNASLSGNYTIFGTGMYIPPAGNGILMSGTGPGNGGTTTGATTTTTTTPESGTVPGAFLSGITGSLGTPFNLIGRFVGDGNGNFVTDTVAQSSPLTAGFSGTYTVNPDCTGNARLTDQNGVTRNINFVLVNAAQGSVGTVAQSSAGQELEFAFSDPGVIGSGTAAPQ